MSHFPVLVCLPGDVYAEDLQPPPAGQQRRCLVCGGPSPGVECRDCFITADVAYERSQDV